MCWHEIAELCQIFEPFLKFKPGMISKFWVLLRVDTRVCDKKVKSALFELQICCVTGKVINACKPGFVNMNDVVVYKLRYLLQIL